jgi:hypothetical protein
MNPKMKINVYFIFFNLGDLTFGITFVGSKPLVAFGNKINELNLKN